MPPRIIEAFTNASIHGMPSNPWYPIIPTTNEAPMKIVETPTLPANRLAKCQRLGRGRIFVTTACCVGSLTAVTWLPLRLPRLLPSLHRQSPGRHRDSSRVLRLARRARYGLKEKRPRQPQPFVRSSQKRLLACDTLPISA